MIDRKRNGTRRVELVAPFDVGFGRIIDAVEMKPVTLDHVLRWQAGMVSDPMALLAELSGLGADILGQLTYPDADIVLQEFTVHCPAAIRASLGQTAIPPPPAAIASEPVPEEQGPAPELAADFEEPDVDTEMFKVA